jgi:hypothetical protein
MKKVIVIVSFISLFLSMGIQSIYAADHHAAMAMEHTAIALSHGELGHTQMLATHAQKALTHTIASAGVHRARHNHMMKADKKLNEALMHANKGHKDLATKATEEALQHIHKAF